MTTFAQAQAEPPTDWLAIAYEDGLLSEEGAAPWVLLARRGDYDMAARCLNWDLMRSRRAAGEDAGEPENTPESARALYEHHVERVRGSYATGRPERFREHAIRRGFLAPEREASNG